MSAGTRLSWDAAAAIGEEVSKRLTPLVVRMKAVGSLRRRRQLVGDIEFIAEPRMITVDLFGTEAPDIEPVKAALCELGTWVQGAARAMRITDLLGHPELQLELYLIHPPANWFAQLAIRTGPAELGKEAMTRFTERGYGHRDGHVIDRAGRAVDTPTEEAWFGLAGLPCMKPQERDFAMELVAGRLRAMNANRARYASRTGR